MSSSCLSCTVRGCESPLIRMESVWRCDRGHTFDIARAGYVNLLQPQDRRAAVPGDRPEAAAARERLLAEGVGASILGGVAREARARLPDGRDRVIDLGAGTGELLTAVAHERTGDAIGIDLSTAAIERAARRAPGITWVVANADRRLPVRDGCVDLVLSMHARRNPGECARVLRPGGSLLVVVPAADDLVELRAAIGGEARARSRADAVRGEHAGRFAVLQQTRLEERHHLDEGRLLSLLQATYRGARHSAAARVADLRPMVVTLASDLLVFGRR